MKKKRWALRQTLRRRFFFCSWSRVAGPNLDGRISTEGGTRPSHWALWMEVGRDIVRLRGVLGTGSARPGFSNSFSATSTSAPDSRRHDVPALGMFVVTAFASRSFLFVRLLTFLHDTLFTAAHEDRSIPGRDRHSLWSGSTGIQGATRDTNQQRQQTCTQRRLASAFSTLSVRLLVFSPSHFGDHELVRKKDATTSPPYHQLPIGSQPIRHGEPLDDSPIPASSSLSDGQSLEASLRATRRGQTALKGHPLSKSVGGSSQRTRSKCRIETARTAVGCRRRSARSHWKKCVSAAHWATNQGEENCATADRRAA